MTMKMTERDKKLLVFLLIILLLFLFGWVLIRPILKKGLELSEDTTRQEQILAENELKMMQLSVLLQKVPQKQEQVKQCRDFFYPMMTEQEIDRIFTGAAMKKGLEVKRLYIAIAGESQQVPPYVLYEQKGQTAEAGTGTAEAGAGTAEAYAETAEASAGTAEADTASAAGSRGYLRQAQVELVLTGKRANLQALLDSVANEYPAVLLDTVSWKQTASGWPGGSMEAAGQQDTATLALTMVLYMAQE